MDLHGPEVLVQHEGDEEHGHAGAQAGARVAGAAVVDEAARGVVQEPCVWDRLVGDVDKGLQFRVPRGWLRGMALGLTCQLLQTTALALTWCRARESMERRLAGSLMCMEPRLTTMSGAGAPSLVKGFAWSPSLNMKSCNDWEGVNSESPCSAVSWTREAWPPITTFSGHSDGLVNKCELQRHT